MNGGIIITEEMLDELAERIESTPPDLSTEVKVGDWVRLDMPGYMAYYCAGHVTAIRAQSHLLRLGFGAREDSEYRWTYNGFTGADAPIVEHWRKIDRVVREPNATTVDSVWVQIPIAGVPCATP